MKKFEKETIMTKKKKKEKLRVLYAIFEADPFIKTGGLGDMGGSLPAAVCKTGVDMRLILPKMASIPDEYKARMKTVAEFRVPLGWRQQYCGIQMLKENGVTCYFIDNEYYFKRPRLYSYEDDGERIAFFSKAIVESLRYLPGFFPHILHCNDWHTALSPVFLREHYMGMPRYAQVRTVLSVHNLKFQGIFPRKYLSDVLGFSDNSAAAEQLAFYDVINYLKGGLCYSDRLTTVSPTYSAEIRTAYFGEYMDEIFRRRSDVLTGILNGIDESRNSPATNDFLWKKYDISTVKEGKAANKAALQEMLGLPQAPDVPLLVIISRLTEQKGPDLILGILGELMRENIQLAVLGVGDRKYEDDFRYYQSILPDKVRACITFDTPLSNKFYAAADMLLMPSRFEPCGLSQMIAMGYGTIPIVRETGGLADSIIAYNQYEDTGDGFSFANYNAHELLFTIKHALDIYTNRPKSWDALVLRAMRKDFSWASSAKKYASLYHELAAQKE